MFPVLGNCGYPPLQKKKKRKNPERWKHQDTVLSLGTYSHTENIKILNESTVFLLQVVKANRLLLVTATQEKTLGKVILGTYPEGTASIWKRFAVLEKGERSNSFTILLLNLKQTCWCCWKFNFQLKLPRPLGVQIKPLHSQEGTGQGQGHATFLCVFKSVQCKQMKTQTKQPSFNSNTDTVDSRSN